MSLGGFRGCVELVAIVASASFGRWSRANLQFSHKIFHRTSKGRVYYGFIVRPSILQFSHKIFHRTSKGRVYYGFIVRPSF